MKPNPNLISRLDGVLILLYLALISMGWFNIYAADYGEVRTFSLEFKQTYEKQLLWIVVSIFFAASLVIIDSKFYTSFSYVIYGIVIIALVSVLFFGQEVAGSKSWFVIGSFKLQPSEFAKFATALVVAKYLSIRNFNFNNIKHFLISVALIGLPMLLIILQHEAGSALVFAAFALVFYREGLNQWVLIIGVFIVVLFLLALLIEQFIFIGILTGLAALVLWFVRKRKKLLIRLIFFWIIVCSFVVGVDYGFHSILRPHQQERINVLIGKEIDIKTTAYHVTQSKIAIGSGGFWGKGYLKGTQTKYDFVPEQSTDFIFCTIGEEWGFAGSSVVIILYLALIIRIILMAEKQRSVLSRVYGYSVACILFIHFTINIGMTIGLVPIIGIPLPFFSYGGSSLLAFTILLFVFVKFDAERNLILK